MGSRAGVAKVMWGFDGQLDLAWAMGGLGRRYGGEYRDEEGAIGSGPDCLADLTSHLLNVSGETRMPCDPRLWTENPITSAHPACIAAEAASGQVNAERRCHSMRSPASTGTIWEAT